MTSYVSNSYFKAIAKRMEELKVKKWELIANDIEEIENTELAVKEWALHNGVYTCEFEANKPIPFSENKIIKNCRRFRDCKECLDHYLGMDD